MELSNEDFEETRRGLLKKVMCGTRDAAQNLDLECTEMMAEAGFRQGSFSACVVYREQRNVRVVVHADDFAALGPSNTTKNGGEVQGPTGEK